VTQIDGSSACSVCGSTIEPTYRFCPACGAHTSPEVTVSHVERRVIAVLFCDLVNFSELAYRTDAEGVQELLATYLDLVRRELESYGGVVEKFIGDAVVAVFGYEEAHDDDADRALLAALGVLEALRTHNRSGATPLHVHVGVHVGEAVADLGASPAHGEGFVAGHVVNLAQRLQTLAPPDTIIVSREVVDRTQRGFSFSRRPPAPVKGHPGLLENWQLRGTRRRVTPDVLPLVGRDDELRLLTNVLHEVADGTQSQVVTIVGEAGAGKSRLLLEFEAWARTQPFSVVWLRGRCLPYGNGVTFSAVAEILKQSTGVLDSDPPDVVRSKVETALAGEVDAAWLTQRLLPLLGVEVASVERDELFSAWTTALLSLGRESPSVVVIEDVHWADDALRAFVERISTGPLPGHLLLVLTTRPSLVEERPGWPAATARQLVLSPLSATQTEMLVSAELGGAPLSASLRHSLLERAGGNPLFAREFARLVRDARRLGDGDPAEADSLPVPATIHALLAARLDTLSLLERAVLQCAAVIGKVFWAGAVAALGDFDGDEALRTLDVLASHGVVRPRDVSSLAGESEFAFSHALLRDVAYERAPRAWRRNAHLGAVAWVEQVAGSRLEEVAEVLVHHATAALDFATLTDSPELADQAAELARRYAQMAAHRAIALDAGRALQMLDVAAQLTSPGDPDEAGILLSWAVAAVAVNRVTEAAAVRQRVVEMLRTGSDRRLLATALMDLGDARYKLGDLEGALAADREAADIGRDLPPVSDEGDPLANLALTLAALANLEGLGVAEEAQRRAEHAGLPIPLQALRARAMLRLQQGDPAGLADHDAALARLVAEHRPTRSIASAMTARAGGVWMVDGPDAAVTAYSEAMDFAMSRGLKNLVEWTRVNRLGPLLESGAVAEALDQALSIWPSLSQGLEGVDALVVVAHAAVELDRRDVVTERLDAVLECAEEALQAAANDPYGVALGVLPALRTLQYLGEHARAHDLLVRFAGVAAARQTPPYVESLTGYVRSALLCGRPDLARVLATLDRVDRTLRGTAQLTAAAWLALDAGQYADAVNGYRATAEVWWSVGNRLEHSYCLVGIATALEVSGDPGVDEGRAEAELARSAMALPWPAVVPVPNQAPRP